MPSIPWDASNCDPIADIERITEEIAQDTGIKQPLMPKTKNEIRTYARGVIYGWIQHLYMLGVPEPYKYVHGIIKTTGKNNA